jgi:hypothetical protein
VFDKVLVMVQQGLAVEHLIVLAADRGELIAAVVLKG